MGELENDEKLNATQPVSEEQKSSAETGVSGPKDYRQILKDTAKDIQAINQKQQYIDNQLKTFEKKNKGKIKTLENRINRLEDKQINIIETLAIFAALFTFVSIEFQIFHSQFSLRETAGLSLIIFGGLIFFISAIDFFLKLDLVSYKKDNKAPSLKTVLSNLFFLIRAAFLLIGIICILVGVWLFSTNKIIQSQNVKIENHSNPNLTIPIHVKKL